MWQDQDVAAFISLEQPATDYLDALVEAKQPIKKNIVKLLALKDEYGPVSVLYAIKKAIITKCGWID